MDSPDFRPWGPSYAELWPTSQENGPESRIWNARNRARPLAHPLIGGRSAGIPPNRSRSPCCPSKRSLNEYFNVDPGTRVRSTHQEAILQVADDDVAFAEDTHGLRTLPHAVRKPRSSGAKRVSNFMRSRFPSQSQGRKATAAFRL